MARPIEATPTLDGGDARRLLDSIDEAHTCMPEEARRRYEMAKRITEEFKRPKRPRWTFPYDRSKAVQVVLWFIDALGSVKRPRLTCLVYLADRMHLAMHGRPIVGGRYIARKHSIVSIELFADITGGCNEFKEARITLRGKELFAGTMVDRNALSKSETDVLDKVCLDFKPCSLHGLRELQDIVCWSTAWKKNAPKVTYAEVPYEDVLADFPKELEDMRDIIDDEQESRDTLGTDTTRHDTSGVHDEPQCTRFAFSPSTSRSDR